MPKTMIVAWREFKSTALTKAFILAAVLVPALMIALAFLGPKLFDPAPPPLEGTIAIVDPDGHLSAASAIEFQPERIRARIQGTAAAVASQPSGLMAENQLSEVTRNPRSMSAVTKAFDINLSLNDKYTPDDLPALKAQLVAGKIVAIVSTGEPAASQPTASNPSESQRAPAPAAAARPAVDVPKLYIASNMNVKHSGLIEDLVQAATGRARIVAAGLDVQTIRDLGRAPEPTTIRVSKEGQEKAEGQGVKIFKMMTPMAFMMLIWMGAFVSANYLLTTTIEEKSNKIMEVLLSAVSPMQLMTGKIIGQAMVGMVMVGMYLSLAVAGLTAMAFADLIEPKDLIYFGLYYIMAYFMIAAIMAAIGSAVNELREAQSLMTPAMLLLMIPLMLWLPISSSPNGTLATVTTFIPPLTPFVMILRVTGGEPIPMWQIIASVIWGYAAMIGMVWMAARIFRVGVLMYGKPPTPMELIKWVRYT